MLPSGASPSALAIGDFNDDFRADVAACEKGLGAIGLYLQTASGSFPSVAGTYPAGQSPTGLVAVRWGNNINRAPADLVAISGPDSKWTVLLNDGTKQGTFTPFQTQYFGTNQRSTNPQLIAAHLNRDQYIDFAYTYDGPNDTKVKWEQNENSSTFRTGSVFATKFAPSGLAIADIDRDGYQDMVTTDPAGNEFWVVFGLPVNGFSDWGGPTANRFASGGTRPIQVAIGELSGDRQLDIAVAHAGSNTLTVFVNTGTSRFGSETSYPLSGSPRRVQLADLNGDGQAELIAITSDNKLQIFQHTGLPGSARYGVPQIIETGADPTTLDLADIDGDRVDDILVGCAGDNTVRIYLNKTFATVTATREKQLPGVEVYPNPATEQVVVRVAASSREPLTATLVDQVGKIVRQTNLQASGNTIPVADLPRGLYLLRLTGTSGTSTKRVVLE
ncbi:T9SS type A sorting domain-containing protein [Hymenobacter sp. 5414T-23]|uniref:T9SS type A sorting domain-containing protein n=1 Tax=Hymenobacter sp. 5414T-23 TaxID=2932252 RepID=UPI001FD38A68|nr:T9SS type A sorting domain-containing protein [Hymenobacter sp. 5414T-23]UOQ83302.1 T9SS type A sorting domain-containing protein [Hymenobacter sp. 5414T-23]